MARAAPGYASLDEWVAREAIPFSLESTESFNAAVDKLVALLAGEVELLGIGEPMHMVEDFPIFRNRMFERLVESHGFSAIAIESSYPRAPLVNEYVAGRGGDSFDAVKHAGFSHGFGALESTRALVEWMRAHNAEPGTRVPLNFYGFDGPMEMVGTDSPRKLLYFVLNYLESVGGNSRERRDRIDELLGDDAAWENPEASFDPAKGIGLSPAANALRVESEDLVSELERRRPELASASDAVRFREAAHYAALARQMLNYHAALARPSEDRLAVGLGIRDAIMADNLSHIVERERGRGRVFVFAHNAHLQRGLARWQLGPHALVWWPAGGQLHHMLGSRYAAIGTAVTESPANGIGPAETGTLEGHLAQRRAPLFIPTYRGCDLPEAAVAGLSTRLGSTSNPGYFPLTGQSVTDFDFLLAL